MKFKKEWSLRKNYRKNEVGSVNMFFETGTRARAFFAFNLSLHISVFNNFMACTLFSVVFITA